MCDHHHNGGGGGGACSRDVAQFDYGAEGLPYTMDRYIHKEGVRTLNESREGSGASVFKSWDEHKDSFRTKYVESDVDEELLFHIPFTAHVKVTGITFIGDLDDSHPARVRIFKDRESMSFAEAHSSKTVQEMELKQDDDAKVDYPLIATKFSNVKTLTLHFPTNFGTERTRIYYIGLRGEFLRPLQQEKVVIATYEARPMLDDHKIHNPLAQHHTLHFGK